MRNPTFMEGAAVALLAGMGGSILYTALTTVFPGDGVFRLLVAGMGLAYLLYLLRRSREHTGRVVTLGFWALAAGVGWLTEPPLELYVLLHCGLIWLVRSLYFYSGVLPALFDLGLNGLALAAATWAAVRTESVFLVTWCFFLVQALYVAIPPAPGRSPTAAPDPEGQEERFRQAYRVAESALRRLSSTR